MSVYNISMLSGNVLEIVQNLNTMSNGYLGLFLVYVPPMIALLIALRDTDDLPESIVVALTFCFTLTVLARLMLLVDDYVVLVNILLLALMSGYLFYRNR